MTKCALTPSHWLWALTDHLGSVRDVVDSNGDLRIHRKFDSFGDIVNETHYDSSGNVVTSLQAGFVDVAFAFTGRYFDPDTGLQNNLNRWYDAGTGRWLSEDPIGFAAGDANLYRYVGNEPTIHIDPSGLHYTIDLGGNNEGSPSPPTDFRPITGSPPTVIDPRTGMELPYYPWMDYRWTPPPFEPDVPYWKTWPEPRNWYEAEIERINGVVEPNYERKPEVSLGDIIEFGAQFSDEHRRRMLREWMQNNIRTRSHCR